jgi:hypothetical protein
LSIEKDLVAGRKVESNTILELFIVFVLCLGVFIISSYFDILEQIVEFSIRYEEWEIDEIIVTFIFLVFALMFFSFRRLRDVNNAKNTLAASNKELEKALAEIKQLKGIIPICAACKKIRDDKGYWHQVESYVRDHSGAEFSHGMCPDCAKEWYPGIVD